MWEMAEFSKAPFFRYYVERAKIEREKESTMMIDSCLSIYDDDEFHQIEMKLRANIFVPIRKEINPCG